MYYNLVIATYNGTDLLFKIQTTAKLEEDVLSYHTDTDEIRIHLTNFCFIKENNESIFKLTNKNAKLTLKELSQSVDIPLKYVNFKHNQYKNIEIEYFLESQDVPLKMILELGEEKNEI